ncbi:MAG: hypothetical protein WA793_11755 [Sphingorhabdus sp.]|uniref:hypothetical protein n=1 Tax=Sphingorhabdus sp. TaxID=1902408 RepID=UPI003CA53731
MSYTQRARERILPLSQAGNLPEAIREWCFTGNTTDHEQANETCQLCGQEGLRYHFEIRNTATHHRLEVGSECILRFEVAVIENGRELNPKETKRALKQHMQKMRLESCLRALERLANSENNDILANALKYYHINKALTPKQANVVFWRLAANRIDHDPTFFKVRLDKQKYRDDLAKMQRRDVHRIWKALSPSQRKKAEDLGHLPPN